MRYKIFVYTDIKNENLAVITKYNFHNSEISSFKKIEAQEYFSNIQAMKKDKIMAICNFSSINRKKYTYYFPFATIVRPEYRGQGFGGVLYKSILYILITQLKTKNILFAQHCAAEPFKTTSEANLIYDSLIKNNYLSLNRIGCLYKKSQLFESLNPKIFNITTNIPNFKHKTLYSDNDILIYRLFEKHQ